MKQTILKKKAENNVLRNRPSELSVQTSSSPADLSEEKLLEKSPWLAEIQNALSPYWSARLAR
jgi:hypothetical protein